MAQQDYVAFAFKKGSEAESKFIDLNDLLNMFVRSVHLTDNGEVTLYTATLPFHRGYSSKIDQYLDLKNELPEDQFDFIRIGEAREDYDDETPNGLIYIDGDGVTVAGLIKLVPKKKKPKKREKMYIGLVLGDYLVNFNCSSYQDVQKAKPKPAPRKAVAEKLFKRFTDKIESLVAEKSFTQIEIVSYLNSGHNPHWCRITDPSDTKKESIPKEYLHALRKDFIAGRTDTINLKQPNGVPFTYIIVPVNGDCE